MMLLICRTNLVPMHSHALMSYTACQLHVAAPLPGIVKEKYIALPLEVTGLPLVTELP